MQRTTFYVGLHAPSDPPQGPSRNAVRRRRRLAKDILSRRYPSGVTFLNGTGVWDGGSEPTLVAIVLSRPTPEAHETTANLLAEALDQDAVLVETAEVSTALVKRAGVAS